MKEPFTWTADSLFLSARQLILTLPAARMKNSYSPLPLPTSGKHAKTRPFQSGCPFFMDISIDLSILTNFIRMHLSDCERYQKFAWTLLCKEPGLTCHFEFYQRQMSKRARKKEGFCRRIMIDSIRR